MKIVFSQQNYHIGHIAYNTQKIKNAIRDAADQGADLILFSELAVCGYPPKDLLEYPSFLEKILAGITDLCSETASIGVLVGAPAPNADGSGKPLYNSVYFLYEKEIKAVIHKTLLPTYDVFDENRYFEPAKSWKVIPFKGKKLAVTICEDIWDTGSPALYTVRPVDELLKEKPDILLNLSASPFDYLQQEERTDILRKNAVSYGLPIIYCNTVGAQTDIIFDGASVAMNKDQQIVCQLADFREDKGCVILDEANSLHSNQTRQPPVAATTDTGIKFHPYRSISSIHQALILGIRDYFRKMNFSHALLASSGGIDSAVVLALACEALGAAQVQAIFMPSAFSSGDSVTDARQLSENTGNPFTTLPITDIYETYLKTLHPVFTDQSFGVTEENLQSRIRGTLAMALSNKTGAILLNTSNKSELATGYGTLYGDMNGGLSVLGDLYKTQVYALAEYINKDRIIIPPNILEKAPSAELHPGQKDSDSLPDYPILDSILWHHIEQKQSAPEIIQQGYNPDTVYQTLKRVHQNEYKRHQFCPVLRVSPKAFGYGRRMPIVSDAL